MWSILVGGSDVIGWNREHFRSCRNKRGLQGKPERLVANWFRRWRSRKSELESVSLELECEVCCNDVSSAAGAAPRRDVVGTPRGSLKVAPALHADAKGFVFTPRIRAE